MPPALSKEQKHLDEIVACDAFVYRNTHLHLYMCTYAHVKREMCRLSMDEREAERDGKYVYIDITVYCEHSGVVRKLILSSHHTRVIIIHR